GGQTLRRSSELPAPIDSQHESQTRTEKISNRQPDTSSIILLKARLGEPFSANNFTNHPAFPDSPFAAARKIETTGPEAAGEQLGGRACDFRAGYPCGEEAGLTQISDGTFQGTSSANLQDAAGGKPLSRACSGFRAVEQPLSSLKKRGR